MPNNLTGAKVKDTYDQILHVDGGPEATEKTIYSGVGVATAVKIGTDSASVDNIRLAGNVISALNTNGNLILSPNGTGSVSMTKAAITGGTITGITDLAVADGGTGASDATSARSNLGLGSMATQDANSVAITGGTIQNVTFTGSFSGMTLVQATNMLATGSTGYTTGAGGTVTQSTSRTTAVTLDDVTCGAITLAAGSLAGHEADEFQFNNNQIAADDVVIVNIKSGAAAATRKYYTVTVTSVSAGSCTISVGNLDNGAVPATGTDTLVLSFAVIKGVTS